jgi:hypothetical protein
MTSKIFITFGVMVYALVIPFLEINASHVFNEAWPPHARLHEVWQLITNIAIGVIALWLAWKKAEIQIASVLNLAVLGGVLIAHALDESYGGSINSGNIESTLLGLHVAVFAAGLVVVLAIAAFFIDRREQTK